MTVGDYRRALPLGDPAAEEEAEFKANGYVRRPVGADVKHETHIAARVAFDDAALERDASTEPCRRGERLAREIRVATDFLTE